MRACSELETNRFLQYGLYPLLFVAMLFYASWELGQTPAELGRYYGFYLTALVVILLAVETLHPLRAEWKMTRQSFWRRDLPYMVIGGLTIGVANYAAAGLLLHLGMARGSSPVMLGFVPAVVLALLIPDFIWYWVHRYSHEGRGRLGRWFWKMHLAHHLPQQVYLLMHAVAHPLNTIIVRTILTVPLFFLGFSVETLFVANLIVGLQGFVSHFNVDIRAGWANYFLMGTELHRYHHSADPAEAKNYGAVVTLWDQLFGTFYYRPGVVAQRLGLQHPQQYPSDRHIVQVLLLPFK
ncbi:MAG: sterol desaturase family protein [Gammaproteobacteria bacterium]|nr:sterol desaturase family protein [Gammaproteobacteria bacterium]